MLFPLKEAFGGLGSLRQWTIGRIFHPCFITHFTIRYPVIFVVSFIPLFAVEFPEVTVVICRGLIFSSLCPSSPQKVLSLPRCNQNRGGRIRQRLSFGPPTKRIIILPDPCKVISNKARGK